MELLANLGQISFIFGWNHLQIWMLLFSDFDGTILRHWCHHTQILVNSIETSIKLLVDFCGTPSRLGWVPLKILAESLADVGGTHCRLCWSCLQIRLKFLAYLDFTVRTSVWHYSLIWMVPFSDLDDTIHRFGCHDKQIWLNSLIYFDVTPCTFLWKPFQIRLEHLERLDEALSRLR
jgi:hypothetical protein